MKIFSSKKRICNFIKRPNGKRGLTIIESLVAITILVTAVLGPIVIVSKALQASIYVRDQVTAFYLAQEGLEYVRNIRDTNSLTKSTSTDWLDDMVVPVGMTTPVDLDMSTVVTKTSDYQLVKGSISGKYELRQCDTSGCPPLNISAATKIYGDESGAQVQTVFTRSVWFEKAAGDDDASTEIVVAVKVSWILGPATHSFILRENLQNWKLD